MDDEYLPDASSTSGRTAFDDLVDFSATALEYIGRTNRSKEQDDMNARGMNSSYFLSREILAFIAGPWVKNAAVQIQNVAFGDDVETGAEGSRRCRSIAETREDDLAQKVDLGRQRLREICMRLKDAHSVGWASLAPEMLDNATWYTEKQTKLNICPLSIVELDCIVDAASRLLTKFPSLAKIYKDEAAVISAYGDFKDIYECAFKQWERRMRAGEYHFGLDYDSY